MNEHFTRDTVVFGHVSPDTARVVDDYPYGRRVRTQIRYWIETVKGKGDRFVSQTLNPKTGRWNAPKPSTYAPVMAMYVKDVDGVGHVTYESVSNWAEDEWIARFLAVVGDNLLPWQRDSLARVMGMKRAFAGVTFTVGVDGTPPTPEDEANQRRAHTWLAHQVAAKTAAARADLS